jgi:hypothetical protein
MRPYRIVLPAVLVAAVADPAGARTEARTGGSVIPMTSLEIAVPCAPMLRASALISVSTIAA